jgi:hypothetical protein
MLPGNMVDVGPLTVQRVSDTRWIVLTPDLEMCAVDECDEDFGFLGEGWAVEAVMQAEQIGDGAEMALAFDGSDLY